jgi:predicted regulator of Ras-like GTPase activity (Roadblock/LC7/MglB family)
MNSDTEIQNIIEDLKNSVNIESAIIRKDGRLLCSNFELDFHSNEIFGAMSTTMVGAAKNISAECRKGYPERIIIYTGDSHIIISNTKSRTFLMCMVNGMDNIQGLISHIDKAVDRLNQILH